MSDPLDTLPFMSAGGVVRAVAGSIVLLCACVLSVGHARAEATPASASASAQSAPRVVASVTADHRVPATADASGAAASSSSEAAQTIASRHARAALRASAAFDWTTYCYRRLGCTGVVSEDSLIPYFERQLVSAPKASARHARLLRRLAEAYFERTSKYACDVHDLDRAVVDVEKLHTDRSELVSRRERVRERRDGSRAKVIELYRRFVDEHPSDPMADEVLLYLAQEYEMAARAVADDRAGAVR